MTPHRPEKRTRATRRQFLHCAAAAVAAPYIVPSTVLGKNAPSERVTIGIIGCGGRNTVHIRTLLPMALAQILAVCDPDARRRDSRKRMVETGYGQAKGATYKGCATYNDFRELLARDDIDAVFIATPGQWHALHYVASAQAGKDVFGEKPLTLTAAEGRIVCDTMKRYDTVFQTGLQQRSDARFRHACELAINGYLGRVHTVKVGVPGGATIPRAPAVPVPDYFDYEMWLGPAPFTPYNEVKCQSERFWGHIYDYSLGFIGAWGVHHLDIAQWGVPSLTTGKVQIEGTATFPSEGMANCSVTWNVNLTAADGVRLHFTDTSVNEQGCRFIGDKGWVHVNRSTIKAAPESLLTVKIKPTEKRLYKSDHHHENFLTCVRTRREPVVPAEAGHAATLLPIISDIATRVGGKLTWDFKTERFIGNEQANSMLTRALRSPWSL